MTPTVNSSSEEFTCIVTYNAARIKAVNMYLLVNAMFSIWSAGVLEYLHRSPDISEPIVYKMLQPRRLTSLWASIACYRNSVACFPLDIFKTLSVAKIYGVEW
jgi:hypothetical protein